MSKTGKILLFIIVLAIFAWVLHWVYGAQASFDRFEDVPIVSKTEKPPEESSFAHPRHAVTGYLLFGVDDCVPLFVDAPSEYHAICRGS